MSPPRDWSEVLYTYVQTRQRYALYFRALRDTAEGGVAGTQVTNVHLRGLGANVRSETSDRLAGMDIRDQS